MHDVTVKRLIVIGMHPPSGEMIVTGVLAVTITIVTIVKARRARDMTDVTEIEDTEVIDIMIITMIEGSILSEIVMASEAYKARSWARRQSLALSIV